MKNYIPNRSLLVGEEKYAKSAQTKYTSTRSFTRNGRAVRKSVPTAFEQTYKAFLTLNP
jgi:hypothetical protein